MPSLLSGGKPLAGTTGSTTIFITLPTAQLSLGASPSTNTGYTLVTGANGLLGFTSTLGTILFREGVIQSNQTNGNLVIQSTGTGTVNLVGNVLFNGQNLTSLIGTITNLTAINATITNLTVTGSIAFTSATSTATFASSVIIRKDLNVEQQLNAKGNVQLSPDSGIVQIKPGFGGTVQIFPSGLGLMDNVNIGDLQPANGTFVYLTATNLTVQNFTATTFATTTGTFGKIRVLSTASDAVTVAGGMTVTNTLVAGSVSATSVYDSGTRVIRQIIAGTDTVAVTDTGIVSIWNISTLQTVVSRGNTSSNPIHITSTNSATSQSTGALIVDGGVGINGDLYARNIYDNGTRVIKQVIAGVGLSGGGTGPIVALTNTGVTSLIAGTDTRVSTSTGDVTVWDVSTLQSVTNRGWTTTNYIHIQNGYSQIGTGSNSIGGTWTAAVFVVDGDAGVGGNLYINGNFYAAGKSVLTTSSVGGAILGGVDIVVVTNTATGELTFNDVSTLESVTSRGSTTTHVIHFANTSNAISTQTGSLYADGGVGVAKDVFVGGDVYSQGGSPAYNYKLYTPQVTVSTSTPVGSRIGDFWIDPSIGVEYQYVPNGTQTVWIQFIGF
jgi:hypothetical protein